MTDTSKTLIVAILDRSGSMRGRERSTEEGFDELISKQKSEPGTAHVTLAQFDDQYEVVYADKPIEEVPPLKLEPRGMTALNDAIGKTVTDIGAQLNALPEDQRPGLVIVIVMTDGHENSSREFTAAQIKDLIKQQEDVYGWKFIFLGSGIDVQQEATNLRGFGQASSLAFDANAPVAVAAAYAGTSNLVSQMRGGNLNAAYDDSVRLAAMGKDKDGDIDDAKARKLTGSSTS